MTMTFKDHFSGHAADYARYRPRYPASLYADLAARCERHELAWDCGTGNGQAAVGLAAHFDRVVATDASAEQIAQAAPHERVAYHVAPAAHSPLAAAAADLVTVAQALHWFDVEAFYAEVRRVLTPGGVLAVWTYGLQRVSPDIDSLIDRFYGEIVGPYWPPERRHVDAAYQTIPFPFDEEPVPDRVISMTWTLERLLGYLSTWSASQQYVQATGEDPVARIAEDVAAAWGDPAEARRVTWPLYLRVGRVRRV